MEQEDVVCYLLKFYIPLCNAEIERILIERLSKTSYFNCVETQLLPQTLSNKHMILDPRIRNDRLEKLLLFLENDRHSIPYTKKVGRFFLRAYLYDNTLLIRLLQLHNFMYSVPPELVQKLLQQFHRELMSVNTWFHCYCKRAVGYVVLFCLDQRLEEPLLEWMIFGRLVKGSDLVGQSVKDQNLKDSERDFYRKLCTKQQSLEMKGKRKNVILYQQYKD